MNKKTALIILSIILLIAVGLGLNSREKAGNDKTIKIGILNTPNDIAVARKANILKKVFPGYRIKYITFDSGVDANKALMTSSIDFATMGDTNAIVALTSNIPAKLFWLNEICQTNEELIVRKDIGVKNCQDLRNKTVATPFASTSHLSLLYTLKKYQLSNKVTLLDMDTQNIVAAWKRKQIEAAYTWEPTLSVLKKNGLVLKTSKEIGEEGMMTGNVTLVSNRFAEQHPELCHRFFRALVKIHKLRMKKKDEITKLAAQQVGISDQEARLQVNGTRWPSQQEEKAYLSPNGTFLKAMNKAGEFMYANQNLNYLPGQNKYNSFVWREK